jgi:uncharacterized membrane protein
VSIHAHPSLIGTSRLEAFSDGVLAILITIMAFQLLPPDGGRLADLRHVLPDVLAFALSFMFLGIYWNNHHHLFRATEHINSAVMWANHGLLFSLTLIPAATAWLGSHHGDTGPTALYGMIALAAGTAYWILAQCIIRANPDSEVAARIGHDRKGLMSVVLYGSGVLASFAAPYVGIGFYVAASILWIVPDRRLADVETVATTEV